MCLYDWLRLSTSRIVYSILYRTEVNFRDTDLIADVDCVKSGADTAARDGFKILII